MKKFRLSQRTLGVLFLFLFLLSLVMDFLIPNNPTLENFYNYYFLTITVVATVEFLNKDSGSTYGPPGIGMLIYSWIYPLIAPYTHIPLIKGLFSFLDIVLVICIIAAIAIDHPKRTSPP